ncbi:hypothetical protein [Proteiniclasticum ruminis]|uniref:VWFA domain-containing protein n=1 Tax=Proteiniclasticum ruminis TaxID=398199 RepID=A0A1G8K5T6_9CLOT|nr:hypothetical protein [Proteiniclasticum ruminis]SDI38719.1 hypothetical protein SAMN05421804_102210 [Proteiniclasticum ruminis]
MKKLMAAVLSVFMFFGVPFPVYALEQLTSPQELSVESIDTLEEEPIIGEKPSEAPAPVEEENTEAPVETPSEEESKPLEEKPAAEEPDVLSPEIKQEVPSETVIELPEAKEEPAESPKEQSQAPESIEKPTEEAVEKPVEESPEVSEEPLEDPEDLEEELVLSVNTARNYTRAGALKPAVSGPMETMKSMRSGSMAAPMAIGAASALDDPSVFLKKSAVYLPGTHQVEITLEAFATGELSTIIQHIPADIVLVLDQSGSMAWDMNGDEITNRTLYSIRSTLYIRDNSGTLRKVTLTRTSRDGTYTYSYVAGNGNTVTVSVDDEDDVPNWIFYNNTTAIRRRDVLKDALRLFVQQVYNRATTNNVDHKISMIGFAAGNTNGQNYENTEILSRVSGTSPIGYTNTNNNNLRDSLLDVRTYLSRLNTAIDWIEASGATRTDLGMGMAQTVLAQNPIPSGTQRQRVVIMFTDGTPTYTNTFSTEVANSTIASAYNMKNNLDATSFTIGIFNGANPAGTSDENKFMNYVSSNYENAQSMTNPGTGSYTKNYYLTANNQDALNSIFQSISSQIGGATNESLTAQSKLRDRLTEQFEFSSGFNASSVDIKVYNYTGNGTDFESAAPWSLASPQPGGITALVDKPNKKLDITGFDYSANYVAYTQSTGSRGKKIVVKFVVDVKDDFIGGNQVVTNKPDSGIYTPEETFVEAFPVPDVDVPLRYLAQPEHKGIYISQSIPANELIAGNGLSYKTSPGGPLYTVDGYNNAYADLEYILYDTDGTTVLRRFTIGAGDTILSDELNLLLEEVENKKYTFTVKVTPIHTGTVTASSEDIDANLYVWVPKVTATDHEIWWGEQTDITQRMILNGFVNPDPSAVTPLTLVPAVTLEPQFIAGSTVNSIPAYEPEFDSTFKIKLFIGSDEYTSHTVIVPAVSGQGHDDYHFTIFVKKAALTIEKKLKAGSVLDENQSFLFLVEGPTGTYQVAIQGLGSKKITGLKLGDYKVTEITSWSFRYDIDSISIEPAAAYKSTVPDGKIVEISKVSHDVKLIFTNRKTSDKWLSGESYAVNLQGQSQENGTLRREEEDEE